MHDMSHGINIDNAPLSQPCMHISKQINNHTYQLMVFMSWIHCHHIDQYSHWCLCIWSLWHTNVQWHMMVWVFVRFITAFATPSNCMQVFVHIILLLLSFHFPLLLLLFCFLLSCSHRSCSCFCSENLVLYHHSWFLILVFSCWCCREAALLTIKGLDLKPLLGRGVLMGSWTGRATSRRCIQAVHQQQHCRLPLVLRGSWPCKICICNLSAKQGETSLQLHIQRLHPWSMYCRVGLNVCLLVHHHSQLSSFLQASLLFGR